MKRTAMDRYTALARVVRDDISNHQDVLSDARDHRDAWDELSKVNKVLNEHVASGEIEDHESMHVRMLHSEAVEMARLCAKLHRENTRLKIALNRIRMQTDMATMSCETLDEEETLSE